MFLERAMSRATEQTFGPITDKGVVASLIAASGGGMSTSGLQVDEWKFEGIPAGYACQRAISETVGLLPIKLKLRDGKSFDDDYDNPLYWVLHDLFNSELTAYNGKELMTRWLTGWGNAYAELVRDSQGNVIEIWPLVPWRMSVDRDEENRKRWTFRAPNGRKFQWVNNPDAPPIMHLHINSVDGLVGRSPVRINMDSIGLTLAANQFGAEFYNSYAAPAVILSHPGKLGQPGKDNLRESWDKLRGEWGKKHRMAVLSEGMKLERMSCAPDEAQFLETRGLQIEETARIYRVPLFVIQHMTKSTSWGSGIESMMLGWLATGLSPYLENWRQVIARDCITAKFLRTRSAVWITQAIVKTDFKTMQEGLKLQKEGGAISPNEWRAMNEMNPRADALGDEYDVAMANTMPTSLALKKLDPSTTGAV